MKKTFRIELDYAAFGLIIENHYVTDAPAIAKWTISKTWPYVKAYYLRKGAKINEI